MTDHRSVFIATMGSDPGVNLIKRSSFVTGAHGAQLEFDHGRPFQPGLMFLGKARGCFRGAPIATNVSLV